MKSIIFFFFVFISLSTISSAQEKLDLKPIGITSGGASNKQKEYKAPIYFRFFGNGSFVTEDFLHDFIIEEYKGKKSKEIYTNILLIATSMYKSPKDVINKVENKMVTIDGYIGNAGTRESEYGSSTVSVSYRLQFDIKDGKVKINAPIINAIYDNNREYTDIEVYVRALLWDKSKNTVTQIQDKINETIEYIVSKSKSENSDNW